MKADLQLTCMCVCVCVCVCLFTCDLMNRSMPGFPVLHYLLELAQTHVHWVSDATQSNHLILFHPLLLLPSIFPIIRAFPLSWFLATGGQNIGVSAVVSGLTMNIQGWFPLGLTGLISVLSKGLSRIFSSTTVQKQQFFSALMVQLSHPYMTKS